MSKIKVHVLNFHGIFSHIEVVLENTSVEPHAYYGINRWQYPSAQWDDSNAAHIMNIPKQRIEEASSVYSFEINANPDEITNSWKKYWLATRDDASVLNENCAVAVQWFLTEFAGIPKPSLTNVSWNHLALGIIWPSFIPCPVTLPGRIMSNAKFYIEARTTPAVAQQYTHLYLYTSLALATLVFAASVFALTVAATILSGGIAAIAIAGCAAVGVSSTYGFFKVHNVLSAKNIADEMKKKDEPYSLTLGDAARVFAP